MSDESGTLESHLHNELAGGGKCDWQDPYRLSWVGALSAVEGSVITFTQPLRHDVRVEWAPTIYSLSFLQDVGVEDLRIRFPEVEYSGHLSEPGYNAITFTGGVANAWARRVTFENVDNGILADPYSKWHTYQDISFEGRDGHHGFNLNNTADLLTSDVAYAADFVHAYTLDHKANGNVLRRVTTDGLLIELDHHRDASFENLVTDLDVETTFFHGGSTCAGPSSAARGTFWNMAPGFLPPYWGYIQANAVGDINWKEILTEDEEWYEPVDDLWPRDLYEAQRARRLGLPYEDTTETTGGTTDTGAGTNPDTEDTAAAGAESPSTDNPGNRSGCGCGGSAAAAPVLPLLPLLLAYLGRREARDDDADPIQHHQRSGHQEL